MKVIDETNDWILYSDGEVYALSARYSYGPVDQSAEFLLLEEEAEGYKKNGRGAIAQIAKAAASPSGKIRYEKNRPVGDAIKARMRAADNDRYEVNPGFEWLRNQRKDG